ncbi:MAG TPA: hypothetical protein VK671_02045, partial [Mucilaginibacter sp.]|nr:hypothetical protein [Mucilaginibacter sp.]
MKRTALILLMAIYLLSCMGMGINRYYCCGKLASVTLTYGASDNTINKAAKNKNCCRNEKQSFKVKDNHFNVASSSLDRPLPVIIASFISRDSKSVANLLYTKIVYKGNAP